MRSLPSRSSLCVLGQWACGPWWLKRRNIQHPLLVLRRGCQRQE